MTRNKVAALLSFVVAASACGAPPAVLRPEAPGTVEAAGSTTPASRPNVPYDTDEGTAPIPVSNQDPTWGDRGAPVTIVEFSDFQCPYCARVEPTIAQLKEAYGPKNLRIVWKNLPLPFHKNAEPAAEAAQGVFELAGDDAFFQFKALVFTDQPRLGEASAILDWAKRAGVPNIESFKQDLANHRFLPKVKADAELADRIGAHGTPAFFINGISLSGAQPFEKFRAVVDEELQKTRALAERGTPAGKLYAARSKENFHAPDAAPTAKEEPEEKEDTKTVWKVPAGTSPILGPKTALVTIIVFSDFQCPFCKRVEPALSAIRSAYGDKVRILWKNEPLPFHERAMPSAMLALEARAQKGDAAFWMVHDKLFESQPRLEDADLERIATEAKLDLTKVRAAIAQKKHAKAVEADQELAEDVQANGTPHFFVNGRRLVGAQPESAFRKIIDEEIPVAEKLLRTGTPKEKLYDKLIEGGKAPAAPEKKTVRAATSPSPSRGGAQAKVTIQMFSDFQCPFCSRVLPTIAELEKVYGQRIKIVWRDLPLPMHPDAKLAAEAAREAQKQKGNDGFWKMHEKLFANQRALSRSDLDGYARELGLDAAQFARALDTHAHAAAVEADRVAATDGGLSGTPAFLVNDYYVSGAQPFPKFDRLVKRALAEAK